MNFITWTYVNIGIAIPLIGLLFAVFQYFNRKRISKARILKKAIYWGGGFTLLVYIIGIFIWVEPSKPVINLSEPNKGEIANHINSELDYYRYLNENEIRVEISKLLKMDSISVAIELVKFLDNDEAKEEEYDHIFDYCIKNSKLDEANRVIDYFKSSLKKEEAKKTIALENLKRK